MFKVLFWNLQSNLYCHASGKQVRPAKTQVKREIRWWCVFLYSNGIQKFDIAIAILWKCCHWSNNLRLVCRGCEWGSISWCTFVVTTITRANGSTPYLAPTRTRRLGFSHCWGGKRDKNVFCVVYHIFINLRVKYSSVDRIKVVLLIKYLKRPLRGCDRYISGMMVRS